MPLSTLLHILILATMALTSVSAAQTNQEALAIDPETVHARAEAFVDNMVAELDLTEEQAAEVRAILAAGEDERRALLAELQAVRDSDDPRRAKMQRMRGLRDGMRQHQRATREQLDGVLSDEQLAEYDALVAQRREAMRERIRERAGQ